MDSTPKFFKQKKIIMRTLFTIKNLTKVPILLLIYLLFSSQAGFSQAGNIDQIRNGSGKVSGGSLDTCGKCWVNGNAGSSNAHYVEGMSIAYRSLLTGLTNGRSYTYIISYDTKNSDAMAIDYLTHYQRLEPHSPFGHPAEVINPLIFIKNGKEYSMGVTAPGTLNYPVPDPDPTGYWNNSDNGSHGGVDDGTPVDNMPKNSFNALPAAQRVMTIYNGTLLALNYKSQPSLLSTGNTTTFVTIKFTATRDSVLLTWGGHIGSRLDWGYLNGKPRSAGGISGSPYHMRQEDLYAFDKPNPNDSTKINIGNQDRSLSAAAVVPPPECVSPPSLTQCLESTGFTFTIPNPDAGTTYTWTIGSTNTVGAFLPANSTGTSVTVTHTGGGSFTTGGSFTVDITAVKNGITQTCPDAATGTVIDVQVDAQDADNTLQINLNNSTTASLGIQSISPGTTSDYTFLWKLVSQPSGASSSFTNGTSASATFNVLTPFAIGNYVVRVIATQNSSPGCKDSSDVTIVVTGGVDCFVGGPATVCPGSQDNKYFYDPDQNGVADSIPSDFNALWSFNGTHPSATFDGALTYGTVAVDVAALGTSCGTAYTVRLTLTSKTGSTQTSCQKTVSVQDTEAPVITNCPSDRNLSCGAATDTAHTGAPTFTDNCSATLSYSDANSSNCNTSVIKRTWTVTDLCGNTASCVQLIVLKDTEAPTITCLGDGSGNATFSDNCSSAANILSYFKDGGGVHHWTAVDAAGNVSTKDCPITNSSRVTLNNTTTTTNAVQTVVKPITLQSKIGLTKGVETGFLKINAVPNPFTTKVNFHFTSAVSGKAILELYNTTGQRLGVIYEGLVKSGISKDIEYNVHQVGQGTLIYKLRVNDKSANGKLIQLNK